MAAAAARARAMTRDEKLARALVIAERDHLTYRSRYHGVNERGEAVFDAPSRTQPNRSHVVRRSATGEWSCGCAAGEHGLPCGHLGAAYHHWRQIEQAMSAAGCEATRRYHEFGAWLESGGWGYR
jgi:hypothetical protein